MRLTKAGGRRRGEGGRRWASGRRLPWWKRRPPGPRGCQRGRTAVLALLGLMAAPGWAAAEPAGGLFLGPSADRRPAPVLASEAVIDVAGLVARVEIRQSFAHRGHAPVEGVYLFPLPEDAAVDTLELRIGSRRVLGEIREREEARAAYRRARAEGRQAGLVSRERPNLFSLSVANIPPGETVHVHIGYFQQAGYRDGRFTLGLPLTVTPRFLPSSPSAGSADAEAAPASPEVRDGPYRRAGAGEGLGLSIRLRGGLDIADVEFGGASMTALPPGADGAVEYVPARGRVPMDRDFRMSWAPRLGLRPEAAVFRERFGADEYALVMLVPPAAADVVAPDREVILVVDTSGSMAGDSIRQARAAVARAIERLRPGDRFNLIEFDSTARAFFPGAVPANDAYRRIALDHVRSLGADGGTEMAPAIELALTGADAGRLRQVVFVTDGAVGHEEALFALIRARLGESRLFTVGIGHAPNGHFMSQAARWGRGTHVRIANLAEVGTRMDRLLVMLERPALTDIAVEFPDLDDVEIWPRRVPDLYAGEPVLIAARLPWRPDAPPPRLQLEGRSGDGHWLRQLSLPVGEDAPGVASLWARAKIAGLERRMLEGGEPERVRSEVVAVALEHGLVSRYTSLVAVDAESAPGPGPTTTARRIPLIAPAGADGIRLSAVTATATPSGQLLARAGLLLILAVLLFAYDPRRSPRWE
jgi:Ca-activated chloride channel family protein